MNKDSTYICICGATPLETFWIKGSLITDVKWKAGAALYHTGTYMGQKILLVQSGIGRKNTTRALKNLPEKPGIRVALNIGCTGALAPNMSIANLNIPPQVSININGASHFIPKKQMLDFARLTAIAFRGPKAYFLPTMTVKRPFDREDKIALHMKAPDLGCVDFESYYFAQFFSKKCIPYLIVRSVSDTWNLRLPPRSYLNPFWWRRKSLIPTPITQLPNILRFHLATIMACRTNQMFISYLINKIHLLEG